MHFQQLPFHLPLCLCLGRNSCFRDWNWNGFYLRTHGLENMLIFYLPTERHPEGKKILAKNSLQVLYLSSIPLIDLNQSKTTASMERYCCLHSKKGIVQFFFDFIPSRVVELVVIKQVCPRNRATIINPTNPAEKHVRPHRMQMPGSNAEKNMQFPMSLLATRMVEYQNWKTPTVMQKQKRQKGRWLQCPMQVWVHMQWWSNLQIHFPHELQCEYLGPFQQSHFSHRFLQSSLYGFGYFSWSFQTLLLIRMVWKQLHRHMTTSKQVRKLIRRALLSLRRGFRC